MGVSEKFKNTALSVPQLRARPKNLEATLAPGQSERNKTTAIPLLGIFISQLLGKSFNKSIYFEKSGKQQAKSYTLLRTELLWTKWLFKQKPDGS
ncbi:hypothetical protein [Adhaeribacter pallidiroseus]|uniref:Uncharacterized protein n=1 Tax=Adhaeribacter pallidiroseus TaxID=2072847 RepID=A0A369QFY7_9BACT|nr:hypothetical protein [Adhaeribacter pallidiroseus]RDC62465.1 hypothetical protein AHMF7616_01059 [Adhaeribacter pallidiroseus]